MHILGFDTATSACSAALWRDGHITARRFETMVKGHSENLMGMIEEVMKDAGTDYPDLDLIAVTTGPGGFTGIRIGLAAARGLAFAADLPCLGVTTLDAIAHGVEETERQGGAVLVAIESKRADIYAQVFGPRLESPRLESPRLEPLGEARAVLPEDLAEAWAEMLATKPGKRDRVLVAGDGAERAIEGLKSGGIKAVLSQAPQLPDAAVVAALAAERWAANRWTPEPAPGRPRPLYLRPPDAKAPKNGGRLRP